MRARLNPAVLALLLAAGSLLASGCGQEANAPPPAAGPIYGAWRWIESSGGIAGRLMTPDTEGYDQNLHLERPDRFALFKDRDLVASGTFKILGDDPEFVIRYASDKGPSLPEQMLALLAPDTLLLDDLCADCFRHTYARSRR